MKRTRRTSEESSKREMQIAEINEPVKVRADFSPGGKVAPLLIKRRDRRVFRVTRVNSTWE
ncbi:MAG: hypothetical protein V2A58_15740, partial [Planctomycetota bacterium]